jgi:ABC-type antimicrobial peptide transport system ATPase subunit
MVLEHTFDNGFKVCFLFAPPHPAISFILCRTLAETCDFAGKNIIATAIGTVSAPSRRILSPPKRLARNFVLGLPRHEIQTKWWQVTANDIQEALQNRIRARIKDSGEIDKVGDKKVM